MSDSARLTSNFILDIILIQIRPWSSECGCGYFF
nr:MAG TPA: hypothetical protein [Caudoviricetes sp.]